MTGWRCAAALLAESDRRDLAIQALARSATISDLSVRRGVSREFIYQQTDKARTVLDNLRTENPTLTGRRFSPARVARKRQILLVWTAPGGIDCARMRSLEISDKRGRPWNRLAESGWTRRNIFSSFTG